MSGIDTFHAHLDVCAQCRNHPFALCARGSAILVASVAGSIKQTSEQQAFIDKHFPIPAPREGAGDINEETHGVAMGPIELDVKWLLSTGCTVADANALWSEIVAVYNKHLRRS